MKIALAITALLCLLSCAVPAQPLVFRTGDRHYLRSDDHGEYNGAYLFSLASDGSLYQTHYPDTPFEKKPITQKRLGRWHEDNGKLVWIIESNNSKVVYIRNEKGVYVEQDGHYYVPVELIPVTIERNSFRLPEGY